MLYTAPSATEALIVTGGLTKRTPEKPFKIVAGRGVFWLPLFQQVRKLNLGTYSVDVRITAQTAQKIDINVAANAIFRVDPSEEGIVSAARYIEKTDEEIEDIIRKEFDGETRSLIGQMSVEDIITDRMALASEVITNITPKLLSMGWKVDSFQISSITDDNNHIANLSKPELARVEQAAAIAQAEANARVIEKEQEAERLTSQYRRDTDLQVSENTKETAKARAEAEQSGPKAEAEARIEVEEKLSLLAAAQAKRREAELETEVIKPAEAAARERIITAEADADAQRKLAASIASERGILLEKEMLDNLPAIMESLSGALSNGKLTFLGDGEDFNDLIAKFVGTATTLRDTLGTSSAERLDPGHAPQSTQQERPS